MTINHHLTDALLLAYAAGQLSEAFNLVTATHISMCDECRARLASYDALGGAVFEQSGSVEMADDSLGRTLQRLAIPLGEPERRVATSDVPAPLADYLGGNLASVRWRPIGMGVRQAILRTSTTASARLLYIPEGVAVPDHGHRGAELTLVLRGAFRDSTDRFGRGDIEVADATLTHQPVAEAGEPCICLAATDAPLRFSALLPRLAQRFMRI